MLPRQRRVGGIRADFRIARRASPPRRRHSAPPAYHAMRALRHLMASDIALRRYEGAGAGALMLLLKRFII